MELVFVYGTLRQGEQYHHVLGGSRLFRSLARTRGLLSDTFRGYPILEEGPGFIAREVNEVTAETQVTFVVVDKQEETAPPARYMWKILRGAKHVVSPEYYALLAGSFCREFGYSADFWIYFRKLQNIFRVL